MANRMTPSELLAYFFESLDHPDEDSVTLFRDRLTGEDKYEFILMSGVFQAHMMRARDGFESTMMNNISDSDVTECPTIDEMIESAVQAMKNRNKGGQK
jgi:hypothetical protein